MRVHSGAHLGDFVVTVRSNAIRVGKVVKTYPGLRGKLFVGVATENPYPSDYERLGAAIMRRKFSQAQRRVTYRPFLPFYRQNDWKAVLLGSPQMRVFTTREEAYEEVNLCVKAICAPSGRPVIFRILRIRAALRR